MQGHVRKRGNMWYYVFDGGMVNGKRKQIERSGGKTKKEAQEALRNAIKEFENFGSVIDESSMSVADFLDFWFENYVMVNCKHNTQENYRMIIAKHIKPYMGSYKLKQIKPAVLQKFLNDKYHEGYAKKSLAIMKTVLTNSFKYAVHPMGYLRENTTQYIQMPRYNEAPKTKEDLKVIPMHVIRKIMECVPEDNTFYIPFMIGFYTGFRVSEVTGLTWDCIDLYKRTIRVEKILVNVKGEWVFGPPKSRSSYRTVDISPRLCEILKKHKEWQEQNKINYAEYYSTGNVADNFVCTKDWGGNTTPASVKYSSNKVCKELDIGFNFHSLRHTHATMLIEAGANMKDVQRRLGHSRIAITMDTYTHVTERMRSETVDIFDRITE
jgi:ATP-dependent helicase/nuclease subunit A